MAAEHGFVGSYVASKQFETRELTLIGEVVNGHHAFGSAVKLVLAGFEKIRKEPAGPVMTVHDVHLPSKLLAQEKCRLVQKGIASEIIGIGSKRRIPINPFSSGKVRMTQKIVRYPVEDGLAETDLFFTTEQ